MDSNTIICLSSARILEYVLRNNGVNIKTIREPYNLMQSKCPHVYNLVYPKDGSEPYTMDLQEDIYNIQSHSFTKNYGLSYNDPKRLAISRLKQEEMDRKFGFINDEYYYTDDYLYLLKWDMAFFENFRDKAKFVLENIDVLELPHMEYTDKHWHHARILEELFSEDEFDYYRGNSKMRMIDCYKDINGERKYINCIAVRASEKETDIYLYNDKDSRYVQIPFDNFVKAVKNGLVIHNLKVPGLNRALRNSKDKKDKKEEKDDR